MSGTRIIVLQSKKVIYSAIIIGAVILTVFLFILILSDRNNKDETASVTVQSEQKYQAGIYTKELTVGDASVNLQLSLDENNVKSIELITLDETVETMYPLMKPTVEKISEQLASGKALDEIVVSEESQYTEKIIAEAVSEMIQEHTK